MKVDPETGQMMDDSPDNPDSNLRGGKLPGDPGLEDASESGQQSKTTAAMRPGPDGQSSGTTLQGEKESR